MRTVFDIAAIAVVVIELLGFFSRLARKPVDEEGAGFRPSLREAQRRSNPGPQNALRPPGLLRFARNDVSLT